jgi:hypothetical protein
MARWIGWALVALIAFFYIAGGLDLLGELSGGVRTMDSERHHTVLALVVVGVGVWLLARKNR